MGSVRLFTLFYNTHQYSRFLAQLDVVVRCSTVDILKYVSGIRPLCFCGRLAIFIVFANRSSELTRRTGGIGFVLAILRAWLYFVRVRTHLSYEVMSETVALLL